MITDFQHIALSLLALLVIAIVVLIIYNRIYYRREKDIDTRTNQLNTQLALVLNSNKTQVWTFDPTKRIFMLLSQEGHNRTEYTPIDFAQFFNYDDFKKLRQLATVICNSDKEAGTIMVRGQEEEGKPTPTFEIHVSVLTRDKQGKPEMLLGIQHNTTEEVERQEESHRLALRYHTVFNSSLVDMVFYDKDGILTDINDKALESFGVKDRDALLRRKVKITDVPSYRNLDFEHIENTVLSSITDIDATKKKDERIPELTVGGNYYEVTLSTLRDEKHNIQGIITAGRNITEMVQSYHRQQENRKLLLQTTKEIENYIDNINYTLRVSGVRIFNYYPDTHQFDISSDLNKLQYRLSQIRCASLLHESEWRRLRRLFLRMDHRRQGPFSITFQTIFRDEQRRNVYMTFSAVPVTDKDGTITHYFGLCRNDTETIYTEARLREETEKAQETEELKNTFLTNMSYEIRTPLNAVIGFAGLYNSPHDEADEPVFAQEIKYNTNKLLQLVNDILFISKLDARMVEFNYNPCDFASLFEGYCYMGWSAVAPGVAVSVENPYSQLIVNIDEKSLCEVIQKLCAHAARHTTNGTIRAKYEYRHGELNIAIEDTGRGYSSKSLAHIFDRFSRNEEESQDSTGLDMPIIKELVEQMGGSIEMQSEEGKGTTVYVIVPCEMSSLEKRAELI